MTANDDDESLGRETLNSLGWHPTLEETQQGLLLMASDDKSPGAFRYAAFEALVDILSETVNSNNERPQDEECFEVPWWVIDVLVGGWQEYREKLGISLGKAFGLEETGGRRVLTTLDKRHRDLMLGLEVYHIMETEALSVSKAVFKVCENYTDPNDDEKYLISSDRLEKIYYKHRKIITAAYSRKARPSQP